MGSDRSKDRELYLKDLGRTLVSDEELVPHDIADALALAKVGSTVKDGLELKSTNPKDVLGIKKVPLDLIPATALIHQAMAHKCGAIKYGPANWRMEGVSARVYIAACKRHLDKWFDGSIEFDEESGYHELGHAIACLNIILDAQACGKLVDDRPPPAPIAKMLEEWRDK